MLDWSVSTTNDLEFCVRTALEFGELSPAMQARIANLVAEGNLSQRDRMLLSLLEDAIGDGCIRQLSTPISV
ncbi:MAG: hypothetical protein SNJ57_06210 [Cyanobacteriota bacterium]